MYPRTASSCKWTPRGRQHEPERRMSAILFQRWSFVDREEHLITTCFFLMCCNHHKTVWSKIYSLHNCVCVCVCERMLVFVSQFLLLTFPSFFFGADFTRVIYTVIAKSWVRVWETTATSGAQFSFVDMMRYDVIVGACVDLWCCLRFLLFSLCCVLIANVSECVYVWECVFDYRWCFFMMHPITLILWKCDDDALSSHHSYLSITFWMRRWFRQDLRGKV